MAKDIGELKAKLTANTSGFNGAMKLVDRSMKETQNEFKVASSAARAFGTAQDSLKAKQQQLTGQLGIQKEKLAILKAEYEKSVASKGKDAHATQLLSDKLATANAALNNTRADLRGVNLALITQQREAAKAGSGWEKLKKTLSGAGKIFSAAGRAMAVGVTAAAGAVAALGVGVFTMTMKTATASDELMDMSAKTGISVERLQELAYIGGQVGTDVETIAGSMAKLTKSMGNARTSEETANAFKTLGIQTEDANGKLRDSETVFMEAIAALGGVADETERDYLAMTLFGKSAMELNPLIKTSADEMARLAAEAHSSGAVMSEEDVKAAAQLADQMDGLKRALTGVTGTLLSALMPSFQTLATKGGQYLQRFGEIISSSNGDFGKLAEGLGGLAGDIAGEIAGALPELMTAGVSILQGLLSGIIENLPMLVSTAVDIILNLVDFIVANLPLLLDAAVQIILALVQGLTEALPQLIPAMVTAIMTMIQGLLENLPLLVEAAQQLILALIQGILAAIPALVNALPGVGQALVEALQAVVPIMNEIGGNIILGVWDGILAMKDQFSADVKAFFAGIVATVKQALGIKSPSRVMVPLGQYTVQGFVKGLKSATGKMQAEVNASMRGLALSGAEAGISAVNESYVFYAPVSINGQTGQRVSQSVKAKRF